MLCSDGLWGAVSDAAITEHAGAKAPDPDAVPDLVELALRQAGAKSDNVTVLASSGKAEDEATARPGCPRAALGDEVFASTIQASLLEQMEPTSSTTPRSSARSARSTKPSSAFAEEGLNHEQCT
jgi:serine/threonine protein phosphatase PrpC